MEHILVAIVISERNVIELDMRSKFFARVDPDRRRLRAFDGRHWINDRNFRFQNLVDAPS